MNLLSLLNAARYLRFVVLVCTLIAIVTVGLHWTTDPAWLEFGQQCKHIFHISLALSVPLSMYNLYALVFGDHERFKKSAEFMLKEHIPISRVSVYGGSRSSQQDKREQMFDIAFMVTLITLVATSGWVIETCCMVINSVGSVLNGALIRKYMETNLPSEYRSL